MSKTITVTDITSVLKHGINIIIFRVTVPTNIKIAKSGGKVVGPFVTLSAL
jgi:hypothetical protein